MDIILIICAVGYFFYHYFNDGLKDDFTPQQRKEAENYRKMMENYKKFKDKNGW